MKIYRTRSACKYIVALKSELHALARDSGKLISEILIFYMFVYGSFQLFVVFVDNISAFLYHNFPDALRL